MALLRRKLIVTADDLGLSKTIDEGIFKAAETGLLTAVSAVLTRKSGLESIKKFHAQFPNIGIGVHLNVSSGFPLSPGNGISSLVDEQGQFIKPDSTWGRLDKIDKKELRKEAIVQIEQLLKLDVPIDHLNSHFNIFYFYPPFFEILLDLAQDYNVPIRQPLSCSMKLSKHFSNIGIMKRVRKTMVKFVLRQPIKAIQLSKKVNRKSILASEVILKNRKVGCPDYLIDSIWGNPSIDNLKHTLRNLPEGTSEIVWHLAEEIGETNFPSGFDHFYLKGRMSELELFRQSFATLLHEEKIGLIGFKDLDKTSEPSDGSVA